MGYKLRHQRLTNFIKDNFSLSKYPSIACVADGKAEMSYLLAQCGYQVRAIDTRRHFAKNRKTCFTYHREYFNENSKVEESLLVGMHPDHATIEIILAANKNNLPFVIVPCCILGRKEIVNGVNGFNGWIKVLKRLAGDCSETILKFSGKNLVLYRR